MRDAVGTRRSELMREESERMRRGRRPCEGLWTCGDKVGPTLALIAFFGDPAVIVFLQPVGWFVVFTLFFKENS
jgi:hypothetical protein